MEFGCSSAIDNDSLGGSGTSSSKTVINSGCLNLFKWFEELRDITCCDCPSAGAISKDMFSFGL